MHKLKIPIEENPLNKIKVRNAIYPIIIGLGVVGYLFYKKLIRVHLMFSRLAYGPFFG